MSDSLIKFLIEAKKNTYASEKGISKVSSSRKCSNDYEYKSGNLVYHDTYFGGTNFMGCEVIYLDDEVIWGMNYYGNAIDNTLSEEAMDKALRPALMKVGEDEILPIRGPKDFENGDYQYTFNVEGDINKFSGVEEIRKNGRLVYRLICNGGVIK